MFNVKDFGATGDGVTYDNDAFHTALNVIASLSTVSSPDGDSLGTFKRVTSPEGPILFIPRGRYRLKRSLNIVRQIIIQGEGGVAGGVGSSALIFDGGLDSQNRSIPVTGIVIHMPRTVPGWDPTDPTVPAGLIPGLAPGFDPTDPKAAGRFPWVDTTDPSAPVGRGNGTVLRDLALFGNHPPTIACVPPGPPLSDPQFPEWPGALAAVSKSQIIIDPNGNLQVCATGGIPARRFRALRPRRARPPPMARSHGFAKVFR